MNRWICFAVCAVLGLGMLVCGLLVPIHLRAVDAGVLQRAGGKTPALVEHGLALVQDGKLGAARLLLEAATAGNFPDREKLRLAVNSLAARQPALLISGGDASPVMERLFASDSQPPKSGSEPLAEFVVRLENREVILEFLRASPNTKELLRCRSLTNTAIFSPSASASGQAFDAAISISGLLIEENRLTPRLRDNLLALAASANRGADSQPLEQALLDVMSLGQRFNWGQLTAFAGHIEDVETLRLLADQVRNGGRLPVLFSAVEMSGRPAAVAQYLMNFSQTGLTDLGASLRFGAGGVTELMRRNQRLTQSSAFHQRLAAFPLVHPFYQLALDCARWTPWLALMLKWFCYLAGGFLLALAMHFAQPTVSALERPLQARGFHFAREVLFAMGFLLVVLLLSEPFLAQESQRVELPIRIHLHLPSLGSVVPSANTPNHPSIMNQSLLTLLLFFVLQGLLYLGSLVKLAEIRRQSAPPRVKLKLLENEEHLFDAGLYLGFVGTIISFILASLGVTKLSLMGAYSSTSFGIIFVSVFKIFQLRPARRKILLEAEATPVEPVVPAAVNPALATTP